MTEIKFCGVTRATDARLAVESGAAYVGVVFAGGPRRQDDAGALAIFATVPPAVGRVGVFGAESPSVTAARAQALRLRAVQLHGDPQPADVRAMREVWSGEVWAVMRVSGAELPAYADGLFRTADAVLLDAKVDGGLGGTGVVLDWGEIAGALAGLRNRGAKLVLAGGLRPENVAGAVCALRPDVVDVSSGIESAVGIKDVERMRAFRDAVRFAEGER